MNQVAHHQPCFRCSMHMNAGNRKQRIGWSSASRLLCISCMTSIQHSLCVTYSPQQFHVSVAPNSLKTHACMLRHVGFQRQTGSDPENQQIMRIHQQRHLYATQVHVSTLQKLLHHLLVANGSSNMQCPPALSTTTMYQSLCLCACLRCAEGHI